MIVIPRVYPRIIGWHYRHVGTEIFIPLVGAHLHFTQSIRFDRRYREWTPSALAWNLHAKLPYWHLFGARDFYAVAMELSRHWAYCCI